MESVKTASTTHRGNTVRCARRSFTETQANQLMILIRAWVSLMKTIRFHFTIFFYCIAKLNDSLVSFLQPVPVTPLGSPMMASAVRKLHTVRQLASVGVNKMFMVVSVTSANLATGASDWIHPENANVRSQALYIPHGLLPVWKATIDRVVCSVDLCKDGNKLHFTDQTR